MKKFISLLLVLALASAFFAGCGESPSESPNQGNLADASRPDYSAGNIIEFKVYDLYDGTVRSTRRNAEWLETEYCLKITYSIPAVGNEYLASRALREKYNSEIANLFIDEATTPDFLPALKGTAVAADAVFKEIGPRYLVDLNPYLSEGGILEPYVTYVWGNEGSELGLWNDQREYWETSKVALELEGALYALPRRECEPFDLFLGYSKKALELIDEDFDDTPETWDGFVELLRKFKAEKSGAIPLLAYEARASNILAFVASTYGLDFNEDFSWTQKNGEPLWTYYWNEYLEILKDAKELADKGLVQTYSIGGTKMIFNHDFDYESRDYLKANTKYSSEAKAGKSIAGFAAPTDFFLLKSDGGQEKTRWTVSPKAVHQDGYKYALSGSSQFDAHMQLENAGGYIAINKTNHELALRLMDYIAASCSDEGCMTYYFGKEGTMFAESWDSEDAGNYIYDENGKIHFWDDTRWSWQNEKDIFINYDKRAELFAEDEQFPIPDSVEPGKNYATAEEGGDPYGIYAEYGIGFWPAGQNYRSGISMFSDINAYPFQLTAYWEPYGTVWQGESFYKDGPYAEAQISGQSTHIYKGMFATPDESALDKSYAAEYNKKIQKLSELAKQFAIDFLAGKKDTTAWGGYIEALNKAGYMDVWEFYKENSYGYVDTYKEDVMSQSYVHNTQR